MGNRLNEVKLQLDEIKKPHHLNYDSVDKHQEEVKHMVVEVNNLIIADDFIATESRDKLQDV